MKKLSAFIGTILSLIPLGQPLIIKTSLVLSTTGLMLSVSENAYAKNSTFFYNRGSDKANKGDHYGAIADFTKAIEIDPQNDDAFYNRGTSKLELKDYYGAISDFTKAIEIKPASDAYYNRGNSKLELKDYYGAISDFTKTIELNPRDSEAYANRGLAKHELEDYYGAISDYTKSIEINPSYGLAYSNRGITKGIGFNDDEGACDDFKKAASLGYKYRINWLETSEGKWCKDIRLSSTSV